MLNVRASVLHSFGPPAVLTLEEVADPTPAEGQVLIDVHLANITFIETQLRAGNAPRPEMLPKLPAILGNGVAGQVGGRRVMASLNGTGGYAELALADASDVIDVPSELDMRDALALLADGRTATLLARLAEIQAGERVLVEAAAGGVGSLLVQLAHHAGAHVVAAAGGAQKLSLARDLGADTLVDYGRPGWAEHIRDGLPGGLDVVFDGVGGQVGLAAFELLRSGGRFCGFGLASGTFAQVDEQAASARGVRLLRMVPASRAELRDLSLTALDHAAHGRLRAVVGQTFLLGQAADAHAAIEQRATIGKTLLVAR